MHIQSLFRLTSSIISIKYSNKYSIIFNMATVGGKGVRWLILSVTLGAAALGLWIYEFGCASSG